MFISAGKAGNETRKIHGTFVSVQEKQVKKSGKFMEYVYQCRKSRQRNQENSWNMFISAGKAGKETRKIHGIYLSVQEKPAKKSGKFMEYIYQCRKSR